MTEFVRGTGLPVGARLVSSSEPPERRKSPHELARMSHTDRLMYEMAHPVTEQEKLEQLRRECLDLDEQPWADQHDTPPPDGEFER